jgi:hypothetical protein
VKKTTLAAATVSAVSIVSAASIAIVLSLLLSCTVLPRSRVDIHSYERFASKPSLAIGTLSVEHATMEDPIRRMLPDALELAALKNGLSLAPTGTPADVLVDVSVAERELVRDLETLRSISVTATLSSRVDGRTLLKCRFAEETADTLASSYHLASVIETVWKAIAKQLAEQAASGQ